MTLHVFVIIVGWRPTTSTNSCELYSKIFHKIKIKVIIIHRTGIKFLKSPVEQNERLRYELYKRNSYDKSFSVSYVHAKRTATDFNRFAYNLAANNLCERQSKVFKRPISFFIYINIDIQHYTVKNQNHQVLKI